MHMHCTASTTPMESASSSLNFLDCTSEYLLYFKGHEWPASSPAFPHAPDLPVAEKFDILPPGPDDDSTDEYIEVDDPLPAEEQSPIVALTVHLAAALAAARAAAAAAASAALAVPVGADAVPVGVDVDREDPPSPSAVPLPPSPVFTPPPPPPSSPPAVAAPSSSPPLPPPNPSPPDAAGPSSVPHPVVAGAPPPLGPADVFEQPPAHRRPIVILDPPERLQPGQHEIMTIAGNPDFSTKQRKCRVCCTHGIRKDTSFQCRQCRVPLCVHLRICFQRYHTEARYWPVREPHAGWRGGAERQ